MSRTWAPRPGLRASSRGPYPSKVGEGGRGNRDVCRRDSGPLLPLPGPPGLSTPRALRAAPRLWHPIVQSQGQAPGTPRRERPPCTRSRSFASTQASNRADPPQSPPLRRRRAKLPPRDHSATPPGRGLRARAVPPPLAPLSDLQGRRLWPQAAEGRAKQLPALLEARRCARPAIANRDPRELRAAEACGRRRRPRR